MKFKHVNKVARDADGLAEFYGTVFGCEDLRPRKTMSGERVPQGNGAPGSEIYSAWLFLPGVETPFLEMHEYKNALDRPTPLVNEPGYGHISFEVEDIQTTFAAIIKAGGTPLGEITDIGTIDTPFLVVYGRDPEGNVVELEQCWALPTDSMERLKTCSRAVTPNMVTRSRSVHTHHARSSPAQDLVMI